MVLAQLTSREKALYTQLKTNYKDDLVQYQRYLKEEVRLRTELRKTVLPIKSGLQGVQGSGFKSDKPYSAYMRFGPRPSTTNGL